MVNEVTSKMNIFTKNSRWFREGGNDVMRVGAWRRAEDWIGRDFLGVRWLREDRGLEVFFFFFWISGSGKTADQKGGFLGSWAQVLAWVSGPTRSETMMKKTLGFIHGKRWYFTLIIKQIEKN